MNSAAHNRVHAVRVTAVTSPVFDVCLQHVAAGFLVEELVDYIVLLGWTFSSGSAMRSGIAIFCGCPSHSAGYLTSTGRPVHTVNL